MKTLPILTWDAPELRTPSSWVDLENIPKKLIEAMVRTVKVAKGIGLAANQVGELQRIVVTNYRHPLVWINPEITFKSPELYPEMSEGCLSFPGSIVPIARHRIIEIAYFDLHGNHHVEYHDKALSVILQHEIDHLDGITILDYRHKPQEAA